MPWAASWSRARFRYVAEQRRADGDAATCRREGAGERDRLQGDLADAVGVALEPEEDHQRTPQLLEEVDDGGRRLGTLTEDLDAARSRGRQVQLGPARADRGAGRGPVLDLDLLGRHPALERGVARLDAALQDGRHHRGRHRVGLRSVRTVHMGRDDRVGDLERRDAVDHGQPERVGEPDADLEVAGVGGVVAEQHQVVAASLVGVRLDDGRDLPGHVGRPEGDAVRLDVDRRAAPERQRRAQLLRRLGGPQRQHRGLAAGRVGDADGELDGALLVRADRVTGHAPVDSLAVGRQHDLAGRVGHALDADEHPHRIAHQRIRSLAGSNSERGVHRADDDGVQLLHVGHGQLGADHGLLGRQVRQQDVLAQRGRRARRRHVGVVAVAVGQGAAVAGQDRLAAEHVPLHPATRRCGPRRSACTARSWARRSTAPRAGRGTSPAPRSRPP